MLDVMQEGVITQVPRRAALEEVDVFAGLKRPSTLTTM